MKEMALENNNIESGKYAEQDRVELVLAESERILDRINERLERIDRREQEMEIIYQQLDGILYFMEWKLNKRKNAKDM